MNLVNHTLLSLLAVLPFMGTITSAAQFSTPIVGNSARTLYELAADSGEPDASGPVELSAGCHYTKKKGKFVLALCDSEIGFINSPIREMLSKILLANRVPTIVEEDRYSIGVHLICSKEQANYQCQLEDFADYNSRVSK